MRLTSSVNTNMHDFPNINIISDFLCVKHFSTLYVQILFKLSLIERQKLSFKIFCQSQEGLQAP